MGENHEGQPAFPQELVGLGIAELEIDFQVVDMCHGPGVASMPVDGFFSLMVIFLEWIGSSRTFACQDLLVHGLVALCLLVKGALGDGWQMFLFGLYDPRDAQRDRSKQAEK